MTIDDPGPGVAPETMLDVINELRAAGAEAMEIRDAGASPCGSAWIPGWSGTPGALTIDAQDPEPAVFGSGDWRSADAGGGDEHSRRRRWTASNASAGTMSVQQSDRVDVTALRQPKPRQYAQPVK